MLQDLFKTKLQIYDANIYKPVALKYTTYLDVFKFIGETPEKYLKVFKGISDAELAGDMKLKAELKSKLYYIVPAVDIVEGTNRKYKNIKQFTGVMPLDFDHIENAEEFRDFIVEEYDFIIAAWLSASKRGIKALVSIPIVKTPEEYKALFWGLANNAMMQYKGFDTAPQNCVLPLYLAADANIKLTRDWRNWEIKGENPKTKCATPTIIYKYDSQNSDRYKQWCINNVQKAINKIVGNGHPQLRAAAYLFGGYVGSGYLTGNEAQSLINTMIVNNAYLAKKPNVYIRTAAEMIIKGQSEPVRL